MTADVLILAGLAAAATALWLVILVLRGGLSSHNRAALLFTATAVQPLAVTLLSTRRASTLGVETVVSPIGVLFGQALNAATLALCITLVLFPGYRVGRRGRLIIVGAWWMAAALSVANLFSSDPGSAQYQVVFALTLTALVLGVDEPETLVTWGRRFTRVIVGASLAVAVLVPQRAFIGAGILGNFDRTLFGLPRMLGVTPHPNALAAIAVLGLLLEAGHSRGRWPVRTLWLLANVGCVLLAQSNTGYIAAASGLFVLLSMRRRTVRGLAFMAACIAPVVYLVAPAALVPAQLEESSYVTSVSGRDAIWEYALAEWQQHPWTGYGPSMFSPEYLATHFPPSLQQATTGHNQVVQTLAESGLIGLAGLLLLAYGAALCAWRARHVSRGLSLALIFMLGTFSVTETPLRAVGFTALPALVVLAYVVLAARQAGETWRQRQHRPEGMQRADHLPNVA